MTKYSHLFCCTLFFVGCTIQNSSFVTQTFRANEVSFSQFKRGSCLLEGLDKNNYPSQDSKVDSINKECLNEIRSQFGKRFPKLTISLPGISTSPDTSLYLFRLNDIKVSEEDEPPNFGSGPNGIAKALMTLDVEVFDRRSNLVLFRLESNAVILMHSYSDPWGKALSTTVARIVDYIDSNGERHVLKGS